ncbi:hypothetical protein [Escherichia coli]
MNGDNPSPNRPLVTGKVRTSS